MDFDELSRQSIITNTIVRAMPPTQAQFPHKQKQRQKSKNVVTDNGFSGLPYFVQLLMFSGMENHLKNPHELSKLQKALLGWFAANKRALPWRRDNDWYKVFLSEFLLQQTQVSQALPYFQKFYRAYPTVGHLASASEDELLTLWAGLGYYSRARHLLKAAQAIVHEFNGQFPQDFDQALTLPGIGPYTASAILSIAFNRPHAVVDGNVIRVITRLFAIKEDVRKNDVLKKIRHFAQSLLAQNQPGPFNEAMMELGALVCQPTNPKCSLCPLKPWCKAGQTQSYDRIPYKSRPKARQKQYHWVFLFVHGNRILLAKRPPSAMLASLWEFPTHSVKSEKLLGKPEAIPFPYIRSNAAPSEVLPKMKHTYSHIALQYRPLILQVEPDFRFHSTFYVDQQWFTLNEFPSVALHTAHKKILSSKEFRQWWEKFREGINN